MATISKAVLTIRLNSSYVLIIITTFRKVLGLGESTSPAARVSILYCQGVAPIGTGTVFYSSKTQHKGEIVLFKRYSIACTIGLSNEGRQGYEYR